MPLPESAKDRHENQGTAKLYPSDLVVEFYSAQAQIRTLLETQTQLVKQLQRAEYDARAEIAQLTAASQADVEDEEIFKPSTPTPTPVEVPLPRGTQFILARFGPVVLTIEDIATDGREPMYSMHWPREDAGPPLVHRAWATHSELTDPDRAERIQ